MIKTRLLAPTLSILLWLLPPFATADNRIDAQLPLAAELASYGDYNVGVRTISVINPNEVDVLQLNNADPEPTPLPRYDRELTLEIWYPASASATGSTTLSAYMRDAQTLVELEGRAMRDAATIENDGPFPLVILSHGYPGNRYLMSHLGENLASKGYIVVSIDHTDSTYRTQAAFGSTLVNRSLDQIFVLNEMDALGNDESHFLSGLVDANNTAVIGYSMGGYGAVITAGGGVTQLSVDYPWGAPHGLLGIHLAGSQTHLDLIDPRIRTAVAFAPWGMNFGFWDADGLAGIGVPMLFIAGSEDDVSGYENGIRAIWQGASSVDRALLTFNHANHNAGAPYPAPKESYAFNETLGFFPYEHYADAVWETEKLNNHSQHFVTAWLAHYLKSEPEAETYLDLIPNASDGVYDIVDGVPGENHTYWKGFADRTAKGMRFEWLQATTAAASCDYSDAEQNDGWGWDAASRESCPPLPTDSACDYTDADENDGWGWNPETRTSCPPQ
jgi:predicted dienelactone hydrolase